MGEITLKECTDKFIFYYIKFYQSNNLMNNSY